MGPPRAVRIIEVGPRDGLQNVKTNVPTATKIELIERLRRSGLKSIELTSIVSAKAIPQLSDFAEVLVNPTVRSLLSDPLLRCPVLIPNLKGLETAVEKGVREVAVFVSASEGFSKANINCSVEEGLRRATAVAKRACNLGLEARGYVSCIFSCPFDGKTDPSAVFHCVKRLLDAGCYEVSLGDTLGVGVPSQTKNLIRHLLSAGVPASKLAGHFHDTYGQAVANVWAAFECGVTAFDSSVSGLGGCPYAPGAMGNVATEDLAYLFKQANVVTGIDLDALVDTGTWISARLSRPNASRVSNALAVKRSTQNPTGGNTSTERQLDWRRWDLHVDEDDHIQVHQSGVNLKITLNRPRNGNALTTSMIERVTTIIEMVQSQFPAITRLVLAANGKYFCTGMDLSRGGTAVAKGGSSSDSQFERLTKLLETIERCRQTTIACIQGPAFGGGVGIAFACDIRIAAPTASMKLSEVRLGLSPATISKHVIREWGPAFAREAMLSGRTVPIIELKQIGAVAQVSESTTQLHRLLESYLIHLKGCAPRASTMCKELVRLGWSNAGQEEQSSGIRQIFQEMMKTGSEASLGVKSLQDGRKEIDWDAVSKDTPRSTGRTGNPRL